LTQISNPTSYKSLPHIFCIGTDFKPQIIGVYDPNWGEGDIGGYIPGKFRDYKGDTIYDDSQYKDKKCLTFYFKDNPLFGNWPGIRKIGRSHFHIKYVVSANTIDPSSVYIKTDDGDILIFATLIRTPPITIIRDSGAQETLFEVKPHLSSTELEELITNINFIVKVKEQYMNAITKQRELEGENFLANSRALASDMNNLLLQEVVNSLLKRQNILLDQFIKLKLANRERLAQGIQMIEGQYNLAAPWDTITLEDTEKSVASIQAEIRAFTAMTKNNNLADNQKQIICQMAINACDLEYVQRYVGGVREYSMHTPTGVQNLALSGKSNMTTLMLEYIRMRDDGQITPQKCDELIAELLDKTRRDMGKNNSPNGAVETLRQHILGDGGETNLGTGTAKQQPAGLITE